MKHNINDFQSFIWHFYKHNGREFAWRSTDNPYHILISEIMLQQTQTYRVVTKFEEFLVAFPTIEVLAQASLRDVLSVWQGLGYYRRARFLHQIAKIVVDEYNGTIAQDPQILQTFPGIGVNTAASICAFAFNMPTVFIETNIRTVFIHHFFSAQTEVADKELLPLVAVAVDRCNPREWYYALMDYGVWLKNQHTNPSRRSAHYNKQTKFEGSDRQIRAAILKLITERYMLKDVDIFTTVDADEKRIMNIIKQLESEQFVVKNNDGMYTIVE